MKKNTIFHLIIGLLCCKNSFTQEIIVIIDGVESNRPLTVNDFKRKPYAGNTDDGNTSSSVAYDYKDMKVIGDSVHIGGIVVKVIMNSDKSWIKEGKEINYLLKHEQGHLDVKLLWGLALKKAFTDITLPKDNFKARVDDMAAAINNKYLEMDIQYDAETDHSRNRAEQEKWDQFFKDNLPIGFGGV